MENATNNRQVNQSFDFLALKRLLDKNGHHKLKVITDSMEPLIKVGETVTLSPVILNDLELFDIILFKQAAKLNAHFLVKINHKEDQYITRSLKFPNSNDYPIKWDQILGVVTSKKLGWFLKLKVMWASLRS